MSNPVLPSQSPDQFVAADLAARLERLHGPPWQVDRKGAITTISPEWFAGYHASQHPLIFDHDDGLYSYDDLEGIYVRDSEYKLAMDVSRQILFAARTGDIPELVWKRSLPTLRSVVDAIKGLTHQNEAFQHKQPLLALSNGVLEIKSDQVRFHAFSPKFRLRHKSAVGYDPKAGAPRFMEEFLGSMLDPDDVDLALRHLGLCVIGLNPCHRMGILNGASAAGKTTLVNIVISLRGEDRCCQLRTEHLDNQFEIDAFRGRDLLIGSDVGEDFLNLKGAATLKGLCSADLYHPEAKNRRDRRPLRGPFNVVIATNCALTYRPQGDAEAWRRRLIIYECTTPPGRKRITAFDQVLLREEGPGIVNVLMEGARRALREIEETGDLRLTDEQLERIDRLLLRSESMEAFVTGCIKADEDADITSQELVEGYAAFCTVNGWAPDPEPRALYKAGKLIMRHFGRAKSHDIRRDRKTLRGWRGLRLNPLIPCAQA